MDEILCVWSWKGDVKHFQGKAASPDDAQATYFVVAPFKEAGSRLKTYQGHSQPGLPDNALLGKFFKNSVKRETHFKETPSQEFKNAVHRSLEAIQQGRLAKLVLSAVKVTKEPLDAQRLMNAFDTLRHQHPGDFVCFLLSPDHGVWLGASPELLLACETNTFYSVALAGTRPASDEENPAPWPAKEIEEQEFVTRYIENVLVKNGVKGLRIQGPFTRKTNTLEHLCTEFSGSHGGAGYRAILHMALELHPTPAVGGVPPETACAMAGNFEKHDRGLYTGFWGFLDPLKSMLFVNIRCLQACAAEAVFYAGAGITAHSNPDEEWIEVRRKMRTAALALKSSGLYDV